MTRGNFEEAVWFQHVWSNLGAPKKLCNFWTGECSFYNEASSYFTNPQNIEKFRNEIQPAHVTTDPDDVEVRHPRRSRLQSQLLIDIFPRPKTGQYLQTAFQFKTIKQICNDKDISPIYTLPGTNTSIRSWLVGKSRSKQKRIFIYRS